MIDVAHFSSLHFSLFMTLSTFHDYVSHGPFSTGVSAKLFQPSVSEDDRKSKRATIRISGERDPGEKRRGPLLFLYQTPLVARSLVQSSTDREPGTG